MLHGCVEAGESRVQTTTVCAVWSNLQGEYSDIVVGGERACQQGVVVAVPVIQRLVGLNQLRNEVCLVAAAGTGAVVCRYLLENHIVLQRGGDGVCADSVSSRCISLDHATEVVGVLVGRDPAGLAEVARADVGGWLGGKVGVDLNVISLSCSPELAEVDGPGAVVDVRAAVLGRVVVSLPIGVEGRDRV